LTHFARSERSEKKISKGVHFSGKANFPSILYKNNLLFFAIFCRKAQMQNKARKIEKF
jgi:hypothetical protein